MNLLVPFHTKSGLNSPFLVGTRQHFDRLSDQAEGKKDFSRKGGYQGGFGISS
jgi:hypothetical protein